MSNVPEEYPYDDFRLLEIEIDTLAKLKIISHTTQNTDEIVLTPHLSPSNLKKYTKKTKIILAPDGSVVYPQSLYLISKLRGEGKVKDTYSIAKALLLFTRFLYASHSEQYDQNGDVVPPEYLTYKKLTQYEEEGAPWRFAEFLLSNCRHRNSEGDEALSLATAKSYMNSVLAFYKWLQNSGYIKDNCEHVVTHYSKVTLRYDQGSEQHDILAHMRTNKPHEADISNIMKIFPRSDSTPSHKKLKPMKVKDQDLFYQHIEHLPKPFSLMFRLAVETGTRIDELRHFPSHQVGEINTTGLDVVPIQITVTKFNKPRVIEVPNAIYEELEIYKYSKQRLRNTTKRNTLQNTEKKLTSSGILFLSNKGTVYSLNTLEKQFADLRQHLTKIDPTWYYRVHDLRATFATNWLLIEARERGVSFEFLLDELASLMGHVSTLTTQKYIKFMQEGASQRSAAKRKNNKLSLMGEYDG
ncbi:tyrosine-type recombinase/integrase [Vibrio splendidus]|uniref:tyrosine-type recombinase/integrase n=1 Tax=Vibrio splendidus TaxID=29497 RepID=UPI0034A0C381